MFYKTFRNLIITALLFLFSASASAITIGLMPKFTSDPYFVAANQGAQEAAKELGITVEFNGPVDADVSAQVDIV